MNKQVDQYVAEMRFDNRDFEKNVKGTISSLDKLKKNLNFENTVKHVGDLGKAIKNVSFNGLAAGVDSVNAKFSKMDVIATTTLANITNSMVNTAKRTANMFTLEPIATGFNEYELKMNSVQTIMSSTGESIETVNEYLNELNTYSDRTIYSFQDMTSNIGKFTNSGVKLRDAVDAMKGISNEAAVSGANANEASRAMYNLSQALSMGYVQYIDWKSIENANMATVEFKQNLLDEAVALGVVKKAGDKYTTSTGKSYKMQAMFKDAMQDQWLTNKVLIETLKAYSNEETDIGKKAYAAAQDVKTFSMMMDTLKEAAQSGWAQTWELIIGDLPTAKKLWTGLSSVISDVLDKSATKRNNLIKGAFENSVTEENWKNIKKASNYTSEFRKKLKKAAREHNIDIDSMIKKEGSFGATLKSGWLTSDIFNEAIAGNKKLQRELLKTSSDTSSVVDNLTKRSGRELLFDGISRSARSMGKIFEIAGKEFRKIFPPTTSKQLYDLIKQFNNFSKILENDVVAHTGEISHLFRGLFTLCGSIKNGLSELVHKGFQTLNGVLEATHFNIFAVINVMGDLLFKLADFSNEVSNTANGGVDMFASSLKDIIQEIVDFGNHLSVVSKIVDGIHGAATYMAKVLRNAFPEIISFFKTVSEKMKPFSDEIDRLLSSTDKSSGFIDFFKLAFNVIVAVGVGLKDLITAVIPGLLELLGSSKGTYMINNGFLSILYSRVFALTHSFKDVAKFIKRLFDDFEDVMYNSNKVKKSFVKSLTSVSKALDGFQAQVKSKALINVAIALGIMTAALIGLTLVDSIKLIGAAAALAVLGGELVGILTLLPKVKRSLPTIIKSVIVFIGLSSAVSILAGAIRKMGDISIRDTMKAVGAIDVLMVSLVLFTRNAKSNRDVTSAVVEFTTLATAFTTLSKVVMSLGGMNTSELTQGIVSLEIMMASLHLFIEHTNGSKATIAVTAGLAVALRMMVGVIEIMGKLPLDQLAKGLLGLGSALVAIGLSARAFPKNMPAIGAGIILITVAIRLLYSSVKRMSTLSWDELCRGLIGMASSMGILLLSLRNAENIANGAIGLTLLSVAIGTFIPMLIILSRIPLTKVATSFITLAGAFMMISVAGQAVEAVTPGLLTLSKVLLAVSASVAVFGAGLTLIGIGLTSLGVGITTFSGSLVANATAIVGAVNIILSGIMQLLPMIIHNLQNSIHAICSVISESEPEIRTAVLKCFDSILKSLALYIPSMADSIFNILLGLLRAMRKYVPELVAVGADLISDVVTSIGNVLKQSIDQGDIYKLILSLGTLTIVVYMLANLRKEIPKAMLGVLGLGGILTELALVLAGIGQMTRIPGLGKAIDDGGGLLVSMGNAIGKFIGAILGSGLATAIQTFSNIDMGGAVPNVLGLEALLMALVPLTILVSKIPSIKPKQVLAVAAMEPLLLLMGGVASLLSSMSINIPMETVTQLSILMFVLSECAIMVNKIPDVKPNFLKTFLLLEVALLGVGGVLAILSNFKISTSMETVTQLSALMFMMVGVAKILSTIGVSAKNIALGAAAMTILVVPLGILGLILAMMAALKVTDGIENAKALCLLLGTMTAVTAVLALIGGAVENILMGAAALTVLVIPIGLLGGILALMSALNVKDAITNAEALSKILLTMAVVTAILTPIGMLAPAAIAGAASLSAVIAILGGVIVGIGALNEQFPQIEEFLDSGVDLLCKLGEGIGRIISSIAVGVTSNLPKIGINLSLFGISIMPFIKSMKSIDKSTAESISILAKALLDLTKASLVNQLGEFTSIFVGKKMDLGSSFTKLGRGISSFGKKVAGVDGKSVVDAANATKALVEALAAIPRNGGWLGKILGNRNMKAFSDNIPKFGNGIVKFSNSVSGKLDIDAVNEGVDAGKALCELASAIPNEGGLLSMIVGDNNAIKAFADNMVSFAEGIVGFSDVVDGSINKDEIANAVEAGKSVIEMLKAIPNEGGLLSDIVGDNSIGTFVSNLQALMDLDMDQLTNVINSVSNLAQAMSTANEFKDSINNLAHSITNSFITEINSNGTEVVNTITSFLDYIIGIFNGRYSKFKEAGEYVTQGFMNGIKSKIDNGDVYAAGYDLGNRAYEGARKALDEHSPSKKMYQVGEYAVMGFVNAYKDGRRSVDNVTKIVFGEYVNSAKNVVSKTKEASSALKSYLTNFSNTSSKISKGSRAYKNASKAMNLFAGSIYKNSNYYKQDQNNLKSYIEAYKKAKDEARSGSNDLSKLYKKRSDLQKKYDEAQKNSKSTDSIQSQIDNTTESIKKQESATNSNASAITKAKNKIIKAQKDMAKNAKKAFEDYRNSIKSTIAEYNKLSSISANMSVDLTSKWEADDATQVSDKRNAYEDAVKRRQEAERGYLDAKRLSDAYGNSVSATLDDVTKKERIYKAALNAESEAYNKLDYSRNEYLSNLKSTNDAKDEWLKNLKKLSGLEGMSKEFMNYLRGLGFDGATIVKNILASGKNVKALSDEYGRSLRLAGREMVAQYGKGVSDTRAWGNNMVALEKKMRKNGLSDKIIDEQLAEWQAKGVDANQELTALLSMSDTEWKILKQNLKAEAKATDIVADQVIAVQARANKKTLAKQAIHDRDNINKAKKTGESTGKAYADGIKSAVNKSTGIAAGTEVSDGINDSLTSNNTLSKLKDSGKMGAGSYVKGWIEKFTKTDDTDKKKATKSIKKNATTTIEDVNKHLNKAVNKVTKKNSVKAKKSSNKLGSDISAGLLTGLGSPKNVKGLKTTAKGLYKTVDSTVRKESKTHSPSRKMAEIAGYWVDGLCLGMDRNTDRLGNSSANLAGTAIDSMSKALSKIDTTTAGLDTEYTPTIRPVIDLSDVRIGDHTLTDVVESMLTPSSGTIDAGDVANRLADLQSFTPAKLQSQNRQNPVTNNSTNNNVTQENTFNITSTDPHGVADEVSHVLQRQLERREAVWA